MERAGACHFIIPILALVISNLDGTTSKGYLEILRIKRAYSRTLGMLSMLNSCTDKICISQLAIAVLRKKQTKEKHALCCTFLFRPYAKHIEEITLIQGQAFFIQQRSLSLNYYYYFLILCLF